MPDTRNTPVTVSPDLRISSNSDVALTPVEALQFAERVTLAAMLRQASLMPTRRRRAATIGVRSLPSITRRACA